MTLPDATPVTTPDALIVATLVFEVLHAPPEPEVERLAVAPVHAVAAPVIVPADGSALTVATAVAAAEPQPLVTV